MLTKKTTIPNNKNFCGGNFRDWLEVNLIDKCNAKCTWCIERNGYHPKYHAPWHVIAQKAIDTGKKNIILLGGEPLLYKDLSKLIVMLANNNRDVWITTNGSLLDPHDVSFLRGIKGVNISIHSNNLNENKKITGVMINKGIGSVINGLHEINASVRFNCNCIKGYIDTVGKIEKYILWAKSYCVDKIRFAEIKMDDELFVDIAKVLNYKYGLNDNPFVLGCNSDAVIHGVPVNFRQMCGLQTSMRVLPNEPIQYPKEVLYYDGKIYAGWQTFNKMEADVTNKELVKILRSLEANEISSEEAFLEIVGTKEIIKEKKVVEYVNSSGGCQY